MAVLSRPFDLTVTFPKLTLSLAFVSATLFTPTFSSVVPALAGHQLNRVHDPNVIFTDHNGTTIVYSPVTGQQIPQGLATDGSGSGFSTSAVLWIIFSFVVGTPLLIAGFRGWRLTIGAAVGTAAVLTSWAVITNTLDSGGISDVALTTSVLVLFVLGFCLGLLEMTRAIGILVLGVLGGLAIGVRIVLLRSGLLISDPDAFFANWLIVGSCSIAGSILILWNQRYGILSACASMGSFLCGLGFDLVINKQSGMSRGLRFLFDRNCYHVLDTMKNGYSPPVSTVIILAVSMGVTPFFAFAQWKAFKHPFGGSKYDSFSGSFRESQDVPLDERSVPISR